MSNYPGKSGKTITKNFSKVVKWEPIPLKCPTVDPNLKRLPSIQRASESIKYNLSSLEYFLSPKGGLRECLKISISFSLLFLLIGLPLTVLGFVILEVENILKHTLIIIVLAIIITIILYVIRYHGLRILSLLKGTSPQSNSD